MLGRRLFPKGRLGIGLLTDALRALPRYLAGLLTYNNQRPLQSKVTRLVIALGVLALTILYTTLLIVL